MKIKRITFNKPSDYDDFYKQLAQLLDERERLVKEAEEADKEKKRLAEIIFDIPDNSY